MPSRALVLLAFAAVSLLAAGPSAAQTDPSCTAMTATHLRLRKLDLALGQQRILYRGTLPVSPDVVLDPSASGLRFLMTDDGGNTMADVTVPGGAPTAPGQAGWTGSNLGTTWLYVDHDGSVGGIKRVLVHRGGAQLDAVKLLIYGQGLTFSPPVRHIYLDIYFTATDGTVVCGRRFFHELACNYRNQGGKLNCY